MPFAVNFLMIATELLADSDQMACFMMGVDFFLEYLIIAILLPKDEDEGNVDDLKTLSTKKLTVALAFLALSVFVQKYVSLQLTAPCPPRYFVLMSDREPEDTSVGAEEDGPTEQPSQSPVYLSLFYALSAMYSLT